MNHVQYVMLDKLIKEIHICISNDDYLANIIIHLKPMADYFRFNNWRILVVINF